MIAWCTKSHIDISTGWIPFLSLMQLVTIHAFILKFNLGIFFRFVSFLSPTFTGCIRTLYFSKRVGYLNGFWWSYRSFTLQSTQPFLVNFVSACICYIYIRPLPCVKSYLPDKWDVLLVYTKTSVHNPTLIKNYSNFHLLVFEIGYL